MTKANIRHGEKQERPQGDTGKNILSGGRGGGGPPKNHFYQNGGGIPPTTFWITCSHW